MSDFPFDALWQKKNAQTLEEERRFWDGRADEFNDITHAADKEERHELLDMLVARGALREGFSVLDLGCGAGRFTLEFAQRVLSVTALDLSPNMIAHARENARQQRLANIRFLTQPWQDADLDAQKFTAAFDLVFASMSPAIGSEQSLMQMHAASRRHCFMSGFIYRDDLLLRELLPEVLPGIDVPPYRGGIWYAFNILWQNGIYPDLVCKDTAWTREWSVEKAVDAYVQDLQPYAGRVADLPGALRAALAGRARSGLVLRRVKAKNAWLFWEKEGAAEAD